MDSVGIKSNVAIYTMYSTTNIELAGNFSLLHNGMSTTICWLFSIPQSWLSEADRSNCRIVVIPLVEAVVTSASLPVYFIVFASSAELS